MAPNPPGEYALRWHRTRRPYRRWDKAWADDLRRRHYPRILAEGDSWFSYPREHIAFGKRSNLMQHLANRHRRLILHFSESGHELSTMLKPKNRKLLLDSAKEFHFDLFLWSAGGNDFVGKGTFAKYLNDTGGSSAISWINQTVAHELFDGLRDSFAGFVAESLCVAKNPKMKMLTHTYDRVIPRNKGTKLLGKEFGPWLWPDLNREGKEVPEELWIPVANWFLNEWAKRLKQVKAGLPAELKPRFKLIETRGTLAGIEDWKDEIHPTSEGFKKLAQKFRDAEPDFLAD